LGGTEGGGRRVVVVGGAGCDGYEIWSVGGMEFEVRLKGERRRQ
jgi:hypothetical protein